ncbi:hypothetical protein EMIHUDRAFT_316029 [Emiliania huxleyi CCMP1516]|uniref:Alkyl transferase n=2 Tax=Emiliania huxleyi TaxID=2903 RepID=A0A0D3J9U5_EMIH1|nr:hypothetical protein EMIHUDRAFT_310916 [Emiliania huxleyi CCMP1516]XP_005772709.1 hypothetical protein EMIHUDRAFT_316029 [Emiliania huxleyi CCMP1516]EOD16335.1 hypothetical protein EMIHUDRAFT_310916 [Emiliania huxleyi CCMP1516]EOD20280.1 hypothetical protein EMIHUDRAFT_316029 [Emiliania huxleyi CCMP1516]|eukprot:XP_005768764.1 hypothetical protein EMIHUDRAFT_310916 [Emiliania huxleyi CCMP1516]
MDGNSRWAAARGRPTAEGHAAGVEALRRLIGDCAALGAVRELSVYAFSHENWLRPRSEVQALLSLIESADALLATGVQLSFVGDLTRLSPVPQQLAERAVAREISPREIDEAALSAALREAPHGAPLDRRLADDASTTRAPSDPDLLLRTGGQHRLSNFMLYQCAYTEIVVLDGLWPDFGTAELAGALREFGRRRRTFGRRDEGGDRGDG